MRPFLGEEISCKQKSKVTIDYEKGIVVCISSMFPICILLVTKRQIFGDWEQLEQYVQTDRKEYKRSEIVMPQNLENDRLHEWSTREKEATDKFSKQYDIFF